MRRVTDTVASVITADVVRGPHPSTPPHSAPSSTDSASGPRRLLRVRSLFDVVVLITNYTLPGRAAGPLGTGTTHQTRRRPPCSSSADVTRGTSPAAEVIIAGAPTAQRLSQPPPPARQRVIYPERPPARRSDGPTDRSYTELVLPLPLSTPARRARLVMATFDPSPTARRSHRPRRSVRRGQSIWTSCRGPLAGQIIDHVI